VVAESSQISSQITLLDKHEDKKEVSPSTGCCRLLGQDPNQYARQAAFGIKNTCRCCQALNISTKTISSSLVDADQALYTARGCSEIMQRRMGKSKLQLVFGLFLLATIVSNAGCVLAVFPPPEGPPVAPSITNVYHAKTTTSVTAYWTVSFDPNSQHNWMTFSWRLEAGIWTVKKTWDPASNGNYQWMVSSLTPGVYQYKIEAWSSNEYGNRSTTAGPYTVAVAVPEKPIISNVQSSHTARNVTMSWSITWDPVATGYLVKLYFAPDTNFDESDVISQWTVYRTQYSRWTGVQLYGDYWFKIYAQASNQYGSTNSTQGPFKQVVDVHQPTTETRYPLDDCHVDQGMPDANFDHSDLFVGRRREGGGGEPIRYYYMRSYVKFSGLEGVSDVVSAKLRLKKLYLMFSFTVRCYATEGSWSEHSITWNNQPGYSEQSYQSKLTINASVTWYEWNVTSWVRSHQNSSTPLTFVLVQEGTLWREAYFAAKDGQSPQDQPQLVVQARYENESVGTHLIHKFIYVPKLFIYDPLGADSYQTITSTDTWTTTNTFGYQAGFNVQVQFEKSFDSWSTSQMTITQGLTSCKKNDTAHVGFGGDVFVADIWEAWFRITGYRRVGNQWETYVLSTELVNRSAIPGEFAAARADLSPEYQAMFPDMRNLTGPVRTLHQYGPGVEKTIQLSQTFESGRKEQYEGGVHIDLSYGEYCVVNVQFWLLFHLSYTTSTAKTISSSLHLYDEYNWIEMYVNWPLSSSDAGVFHENPQNYIFWFNYPI